MAPSAFEERPTPVLGIDYGRFKVIRVIGVGSFGTVYEAVQQPLGRHIALKVMHPHLTSRPDVVARFEQEARVAASVRHPNVVEVFDFGLRSRVPYVAMELLEGESLVDTFTREKALLVPVLVDLMFPVLAALSVMHARGVVHCDLKPENIFLSIGNGTRLTPKVLDFGVSLLRAAKSSADARRSPLGTPQYMSPEQIRDPAAISARADLWAMGVILYEGVTGHLPFYGEEAGDTFASILDGMFFPPRSLRPEIPEGFDAIIDRCLSPDPAHRFAKAIDLARALLPFAGDEGRRTWTESFGQPLPAATSSSSPAAMPPAPPAGRSSPPLTGPRPFSGVAPRLAVDPRVYLRSVEVFTRLSPDDADALLSCVRWRSLAPGEVLFREGAPGVTMVFVAEGSLSVCTDSGGVRREFSRVGVGHFVGEMACLDPSPRSATVVAATPAVVGEIARDGLRTLQVVAPQVSAVLVGSVIREVTQRLREVERRIDEALTPSVPPKSASQPPSRDEHAGGMRKLLDWLRGGR